MSRTVLTFKEPDSFDRRITLLSVDHFNEILPLPERVGPHFTMLVAMDGLVETRANFRNVPEDLLEKGLVYLCTWGPDCGPVHDIFSHANPLVVNKPTHAPVTELLVAALARFVFFLGMILEVLEF